MRKAIILHGLAFKDEYYDSAYPSASNSHWLPWIQKQLQVNDIATYTPEVPYAFELIWENWVKEINRYDIDEETILVGHSCGAGFWVRYISENPSLRVGKVILVAPWLDIEKNESKTFFDFKIDPMFVERTEKTIIFQSDNDRQPMQDTFKVLTNQVDNIEVKMFHQYGHFTLSSMKTTKFPELLEYILS